MAKAVIFIVLGALLGAFTGKFVIHHIEAKHRHARSVMTLLSFHEGRLDEAAKAGRCGDFAAEHLRLVALQPEIALAFPQTYQQEADFRKKAEALGTALLAAAPDAAAAPPTCPTAAMLSKHVGDTCEACHKVYDPD
jgi:hypothetical protein